MNENTENTYEDMINLLSKTFGITLMQKRAEYGYTRIVAATKCGITEKQFYNLENGISLPETPTLMNLSITFNIDLNAFRDLIIEKGYVITTKKYK